MSNGSVILDIEGYELNEVEREVLCHPQVAGIIFFSRNYADPRQLTDLVREIKEQREDLLLCVDQEGGRVQRFRKGMTPIPAMQQLGSYFEQHSNHNDFCRDAAWLLACELKALGLDLSFSPVLDLDDHRSRVIGDRAFSRDISLTIKAAKQWIEGLHEAGLPAVGKHFPGHGSVVADSHVDFPIDDREASEILNVDMKPFAQLSMQLDGMMPAHVIYPELDSNPVGFSSYWLKHMLRQQLKFEGVIFSDDLSMKAAEVAGSYCARADDALAAGCDAILICNASSDAIKVIESLESNNYSGSGRLQTLLKTYRAKPSPSNLSQLRKTERFTRTAKQFEQLNNL